MDSSSNRDQSQEKTRGCLSKMQTMKEHRWTQVLNKSSQLSQVIHRISTVNSTINTSPDSLSCSNYCRLISSSIRSHSTLLQTISSMRPWLMAQSSCSSPLQRLRITSTLIMWICREACFRIWTLASLNKLVSPFNANPRQMGWWLEWALVQT